MNRADRQEELKYKALAEAALAAVSGESAETVARKGLATAIEYIGLVAGALLLWNDRGEVTTRAVAAPDQADRQALLDMEDTLLSMLRKDYKLKTAYMELGGDSLRSLFSLPIETSGRQFGALIGIKSGAAHLHIYDYFLRALAAVLALASAPVSDTEGLRPEQLDSRIKAERQAAIVEIAVAINHEINNPLTALMGNLQLLMLKNQNLPEELQARLKVIEESANQIREITGRLMKAADAPTVDYTGGMKMLDLTGKREKKKAEDEGEKEEGA